MFNERICQYLLKNLSDLTTVNYLQKYLIKSKECIVLRQMQGNLFVYMMEAK